TPGRQGQGAPARRFATRRPLKGVCSMGRTLAQKIWDSHVVHHADGEPDLLYTALRRIHEVTSPQAFDGLRLAGRGVRRPDLTVATENHNVPPLGVSGPELPLVGPGRPV